jgi:hypothetical protein
MLPPSAFTHCWRESVQSIIHDASVRCHGRDSARTTSRNGLRKIRCGLPTASEDAPISGHNCVFEDLSEVRCVRPLERMGYNANLIRALIGLQQADKAAMILDE